MASLFEMAQGPKSNIFGAIEAGQNAAYNKQFNQFKLADLARQDQARPLIGQALQGNQGAFSSLAGIDPQSYMDVNKFNLDNKRSQADARGVELKNKQAEYERVAGILRSADTPEKWQRAISYIEQSGATVDPQERDFNNRDFVLAQTESDAAELGLNPIYGVDASGNTVAFQPSKSGGVQQIQFPQGVRVTPGVKTVSDGLNDIVIDSRTGQPVQGGGGYSGGVIPKNVGAVEAAKVEGKDQGENIALLNSMRAKLPGLEDVVKKLETLADKATYTTVGRLVNEGSKQVGLGSTAGGVARVDYVSRVANQVLPLLRDTFGAQFTAAEGERLLATLGNPDASPEEKKATLRAFIDQKKRDIESLTTQTGYQGPDGITNKDIGGLGNNAPREGTVEEGYRFVGGNPADPANWEPAN
jgi:hypothetical protein